MDGVVIEICCSTCIHGDVCAHKEDYLNMVKSLDEMFYKFPENERSFMRLRNPDCKFYSKELETPKPLTRGLTIPENVVMAMVDDGRRSCTKMLEEAAKKYDRKTDV